jgi:hypothetical protein
MISVSPDCAMISKALLRLSSASLRKAEPSPIGSFEPIGVHFPTEVGDPLMKFRRDLLVNGRPRPIVGISGEFPE